MTTVRPQPAAQQQPAAPQPQPRSPARATPSVRSRLLTALLWVATAGLGLYAGIRLAGLDWFTPFAQLVSFTVYAVPAGALLVLLTLLARRWRTAVVAGAVTAALLVVVVPRAIGGDAPAGDGVPLRIMTVNLYHGGATGELMALVRRERPDLLSLQEATAEALDHLERAGLARLLPHHAARPRPGVAGTALYGRADFSRGRTADRGSRFDMVRADYVHRGVRLDLVAAHPSPPVPGPATTAWHRDLRRLPAPHRDDGAVTVLAGDFNATLDHSALRRLLDRGYVDAADAVGAGLSPTWQAGWVPPVTIDHVLAERGVGVRAVRVYRVDGSDHRAVVADLSLPPASPGGQH